MNSHLLETSYKQEDKILTEFVNKMPYPEYKKLLDTLNHNVILSCPYSYDFHTWCQTIYENPTDEKLIVEMGKKIYKKGGLQALKQSHSILSYFSPYMASTDTVIRSQSIMIGKYFHGVCSEWEM
jgi:hypothetical protein